MEINEKPTEVDDRRGALREPLDGWVTVVFDEQQVVGPGQNMSEEGVFFVAEAALHVRVMVEGAWKTGEVIRVQSMGEGKLGMAVRFV